MRKSALIYCFIVFAFGVEAQEWQPLNGNIYTRLGLNTVTGVNLFVTPGKVDSPQISFGLAWNYGLSFLDQCSFLGLSNFKGIRLLTERRGPTLRIGIDRLARKIKNAVYIEGSLFKVHDYNYIESCGDLSEIGAVDKAIYDWYSKQLLLRIYFDFPTRNKTGNLYFSPATGGAHVEKHYSMEGDSNNIYPSSRVEKFWRWASVVDVGYRFGGRWKGMEEIIAVKTAVRFRTSQILCRSYLFIISQKKCIHRLRWMHFFCC